MDLIKEIKSYEKKDENLKFSRTGNNNKKSDILKYNSKNKKK